ncbi:mitotic checkpoint protein BUB3 [Cimex lectularius]|uniref:Mitotic checkpoint protein BUB3 n=1 Tax=Cimex lectularius TaxID=79782 RepID=A0A8I6TEN4_CIMLE|nr:mitotic checkpoint protein BUB3 [Cimex lectularius]
MPAGEPSRGEFRLNYSTEETISAVKFSPSSSQFVLISSWDGSVSLYDVHSNTSRLKYDHNRKPVLDACFQDSAHSFSGGLDNTLKMFDFNAGKDTIVGSHSNAIKVVECSAEHSCILSGGWDAQVKMWDTRSGRCIGSFLQPDKVYTIGLCGEKFVVGTADRKVYVWDMRNMGYVLQRRESSLKYQTRCIRCFPNKQGYVLSSIEGRVAVEYLDARPEIQRKKYAFKCHRIKEGGVEKIYPVNTITFHQGYNTFATGGSDGYVNIWDGFNKKRLCQFHRYPTSITSLSFSQDGGVLAIACSYMYQETDPDPIPESSVYIRYVTDQETKPK